jgi:hypothetical protein
MRDFSGIVEGGVLPPKFVCYTYDGKILKIIDIPDKGYVPITESFEPVIDSYTTIDGRLKYLHRGYRYRCEIKLSYLEKETLRQLKIVYNHLKDRNYLIIYPHRDRLDIKYRVEIEEPFAFGYLSGRMIGYYGTLRLVGISILTAIPTDFKVSHFCSVDGQYNESEITYFISSMEENYSESEISHFCPSDTEVREISL